MFLLCLFIGLISGILSGILGIGGGVIMIPLLLFLFQMTQHQAQGTSLAAMLPPVGLFAVLEYYWKGQVNVRIALVIALGFVIGGFLGAYAAQWIPDKSLQRVFGVFLLLISLRMIFW